MNKDVERKISVVIISISPIARDPRVLRQIDALEGIADLTVLGLTPLPDEVRGISLMRGSSLPSVARLFLKSLIGALLLCRCFRIAEVIYCSVLYSAELKRFRLAPDALIVNDIDGMLIADRFLHQIDQPALPIYLDLHEYAPSEGSRLLDRLVMNPFKRYLCERYLSRGRVISTVSQGIAVAYEKLTGRSVHVVPNVPPYEDLAPQPIKNNKVRLVYHGNIAPDRDLHGLIKALKLLGQGYELHFYLVGTDRSVKAIKDAAQGLPVVFHDPVPIKNITRELNQYDVGVFLLRAESFNSTHAMPNKLFEFVQARLAIVVSPNPEIQAFVVGNKIGKVCRECSGESLAQTICEMPAEAIMDCKWNSHRLSKEYCAEKYHEFIRTLTLRAIKETDSASTAGR